MLLVMCFGNGDGNVKVETVLRVNRLVVDEAVYFS